MKQQHFLASVDKITQEAESRSVGWKLSKFIKVLFQATATSNFCQVLKKMIRYSKSASQIDSENAGKMETKGLKDPHIYSIKLTIQIRFCLNLAARRCAVTCCDRSSFHNSVVSVNHAVTVPSPVYITAQFQTPFALTNGASQSGGRSLKHRSYRHQDWLGPVTGVVRRTINTGRQQASKLRTEGWLWLVAHDSDWWLMGVDWSQLTAHYERRVRNLRKLREFSEFLVSHGSGNKTSWEEEIMLLDSGAHVKCLK